MTVRVSAEHARRTCVVAARLDANRPVGIAPSIYDLVSIPVDPTAAIAPSADHILWSRIGVPYSPADLVKAVEVDRDVFEWRGAYRVMSDLPLLRPTMARSPLFAYGREWLAANRRFRQDVLALLRRDGPLPAAAIPDTAQQSWKSTGWTGNRNSQQMLELLVTTGDVAVSGRDRKGRTFDLAERVYPDDLPEVSGAQAATELAERRLAARGIARAKTLNQPHEDVDPNGIGVPVEIEGVSGEWRADAEALEAATRFRPRTVLLSPFDVLVFDRERLVDIFASDYLLEMYKPAAKRRWGYFALPILHGDRIVGKLDAKFERKQGTLAVHAVHRDSEWTRETSTAVDEEIDALAGWLGATRT